MQNNNLVLLVNMLLRISKQQQQIIKPSVGSFWVWGSDVTAHPWSLTWVQKHMVSLWRGNWIRRSKLEIARSAQSSLHATGQGK